MMTFDVDRSWCVLLVVLGAVLCTSDSARSQTSFEWIHGGTFEQMEFVDSSNGWICGDGGRIAASTDGGLSWQDIETDNASPETWVPLRGFHFMGI